MAQVKFIQEPRKCRGFNSKVQSLLRASVETVSLVFLSSVRTFSHDDPAFFSCLCGCGGVGSCLTVSVGLSGAGIFNQRSGIPQGHMVVTRDALVAFVLFPKPKKHDGFCLGTRLFSSVVGCNEGRLDATG